MPVRKKEGGFKYVYVEDNGRVRELNAEEQGYLKEEFHPGDGNRPYIKLRYREVNPDGKFSGFILRHRVPPTIEIESHE